MDYKTAAQKFRKPSTLDLSEMRDIAARICRDYLTGAWKTISADEIQLKKISGGLSNFLFYVSLPDGNTSPGSNQSKSTLIPSTAKRPRKDSFQEIYEPKEVLLRIYGQSHQGDQALESMVTESVVFTLLSERKLGPKLHGIFPGGRIEQYIPARPLTTLELSDKKISSKVAIKMAEIHSLDIPVSKEPDWLWDTMNRWLHNAEVAINDISPKNDELKDFKSIFEKINFRKEIEWFKSVVEKNNFPVVFCHNDLQEGNILLQQTDANSSSDMFNSTPLDNFDDSAMDSHLSSIILDTNSQKTETKIQNNLSNNNYNIDNNNPRKRSIVDDCAPDVSECDLTRDSVLSADTLENCDDNEPELMIIDFEYCAYNYRGFDLANHFLEYSFDYTNEVHPYFYAKHEQYPNVEQQVKFITEYLRQYHEEGEDFNPDREDVDSILNEIKCFTLASHLFWSLWALVNIQSEIQFGYWDYANVRINQYFQHKDIYLNGIKNNNIERRT